MIGVVTAAGGVPVIAHPWGRGSADVLDAAAFAVLAEAGLFGIEVDHLDHDADQRAELREIAERLGLAVTGSSDHHGTGKVDHHLGVRDHGAGPARADPRPGSGARLPDGNGGCRMNIVDGVLLVEVFVTLFVIMDPVGTVPIFLTLTSGRAPRPRGSTRGRRSASPSW